MRDLRVHTGTLELQVWEYEYSGSPIIFLHYGGANLMMWQRAVPYFEGKYHLILVDLRDHGKSDKPQAGDEIDQMAADVAGLMSAMQLEKAHLVGSSLGAEVALALAANFPEKVISLVCDGALTSEFGPYSTWQESEAAFREHVKKQLDGMRGRAEKVFPSVEAFLADSRENLEKYNLWNEYMEALQAYDACEVRPGEFVRGWQKQARLNYMSGYFDYRFENYYPRVQCPLLMVTGSENEPAEASATQKMCALARQGKLVIVPGWEHPYGWLLHPEAMCQTVLEFLAGAKKKDD
ncbi:MAG: alpha/beta hydrolase [Anaerolineae bacterium]|nr:alpha/beta hydrolase [Anaerolineae bacterium]